jgi:hypothetical protein
VVLLWALLAEESIRLSFFADESMTNVIAAGLILDLDLYKHQSISNIKQRLMLGALFIVFGGRHESLPSSGLRLNAPLIPSLSSFIAIRGFA